MFSRRNLLACLFAAPAVVAIDSLMPLRGIKLNPIIRLQSWPFGTEAVGEWWAHEGPLSGIARIEEAIRDQMGRCFWQSVERGPGLNMDNLLRQGFGGLSTAGSTEREGCFHTAPEDSILDSILDMPLAGRSESASRFGVAHGVPRTDPPLRAPEEIAKREAEMRKFWNNNFRVSPDGHLYREGPYNRNGEYTDWYAKAHASNTDLLCSEHARIHRLPHGETSSQMRTILQERVPSHLRRRTNATA